MDLSNVQKNFLRPVLPVLRHVAEEDQGEDQSRPWSFTDRCCECGGTEAFIKWLEKQCEKGGVDL